MTTYAKDFSDELSTGVFPSDFTERWDTGNAPTIETNAESAENRVFEIDAPSDHYLASWDDIDGDANRDNVEMVVRWKQSVDDDGVLSLIARASGATTSETAYRAIFTSGGNLRLFRMNAGSDTFLDSLDIDLTSNYLFGTAFEKLGSFTNIIADNWAYMRFRVNGTGATVTLSVKYWKEGTAEPAKWDIIYDDTDGSRITSTGWTGVGRGATTGIAYVDYFAVGTNGDTAPINAVASTTVRMSAVWLEVAMALNNPNIDVYNHIKEVMHSNDSPVIRVTKTGIQVIHEVPIPIASGGGGVIQVIN